MRSTTIGASILFALLELFSAGRLAGADVWAVQFSAGATGIAGTPCESLIWWDDLIFHNETATDANVRWIETSNGSAAAPQPLVIPAGHTRAGFRADASEIGSWAPSAGQMWVVHLDVPPGVSVASRAVAEFQAETSTCGPDPGPTAPSGGPRLPVIRSLSAAGSPQVLLATDIGDAAAVGGVRSKIAIYNGGTEDATATIQLRRGCDDTGYGLMTARVPAKTIVQVGGLPSLADSVTAGGGCAAFYASPSLTYAVVTVDQPSFAFATTLAQGLVPRTPYGFAAAE